MRSFLKVAADLRNCLRLSKYCTKLAASVRIRAVSILLFLFLFFSTFFVFGVAQAFKRRFCSGVCYFSVFLLPILLRFWGQICFKEAIMLVKYATLWLFTLPLSP